MRSEAELENQDDLTPQTTIPWGQENTAQRFTAETK
jgi:hypothetical protein